MSENGSLAVDNINPAGLNRSQPQEHRGACGVLDQLSEQPQQEEGGAQSPEQPQYQQPALSVQDTPVSEDGPFSVNENTPAGSDHPQSQESLGVSEVDAQFSDQSQRQFS